MNIEPARLDEVGQWTEIKLNILQEYSAAYSRILANQTAIRHYAYIDGFAGAGTHISKASGQEIDGSPTIALKQNFSHYHFVDLNDDRAERLRNLSKGRNDVTVYQGNCNSVLLDNVFPTCLYKDFRRALCVLDPYGLNPNWEVVQRAGQMKSIEIFLNFMLMDANMNVLWKDPDQISPVNAARMKAFWGDESWKAAAYREDESLFGGTVLEKRSNDAIIQAYKKRLKDVAGFRYVVEPIPMRNSTGAVVYYLFFASQNETGCKIARAIFKKYG